MICILEFLTDEVKNKFYFCIKSFNVIFEIKEETSCKDKLFEEKN